MHNARSFLTVLILAGSLAGATQAIASEVDPSPPSVTSYEANVLRQVAIALASGRDAIQDLRGPAIENSNLDRLKLATPGMACGISRSVIFVSCNSASFNNEKEAEALFTRITDDAQAALPSDGWRRVEAVHPVANPHFIRSISYHNWKSGAQIDVDLIVQPIGQAQAVYYVKVFGWARI
jgi:hypothetical protein